MTIMIVFVQVCCAYTDEIIVVVLCVTDLAEDP